MSDEPRFSPGPLSRINAFPDQDRWTLVFVRTMRHSPEQVWSALTDPAQLNQWAPFDPDRPLDSTGDITLTMTDGTTSESSTGAILRSVPPKLLEYTWGDDLLRWELAPTALDTGSGSGTRLTLSHTMADREWMPKVAAGWHLCLVVAESVIDGRPIGRIVGDAAKNFGWQELADGYREMLATR